MNEAQTWTVIGGLLTFMLGSLTVVWFSFTRVLRAEIGGLRAEMTGQIGALRGEMHGLRGEMTGQIGELRGEMTGQIGELRGEVRALATKVDEIDRDVQTLVKKQFD